MANHRPSTVHKKLPCISIASFGDSEQSGLATSAMLPRDQPQRCGKVTPPLELSTIAELYRQSRSTQWADTPEAAQTAGDWILRGNALDLLGLLINSFIQAHEIILETQKYGAEQVTQPVAGSFKPYGDRRPKRF